MNLAIDIGNTRIKLGFFEGKDLREKLILENENLKELKQLLRNQNVENSICSTVREVDPKLEKLLKNQGFYINLTGETPLPIQNLYGTPKTLGKDRLAAVVGAYELYPKQDCLVIDAGTCTTYDVIDKEGNYIGGNITPGLEMRWKAMHHFTAKLPLATRREEKLDLIGKNTLEALEIGGSLGNTLEMEGWIRCFEEKYPSINTILTGGDTEYFAKRLKTKIFANPNLVLIGLNKILCHNVEILP